MDRLIEPHILAFFTQTYTPSVLKYKGFKSILSQIVLSLTKIRMVLLTHYNFFFRIYIFDMVDINTFLYKLDQTLHCLT
jgi:hypothetical protein